MLFALPRSISSTEGLVLRDDMMTAAPIDGSVMGLGSAKTPCLLLLAGFRRSDDDG